MNVLLLITTFVSLAVAAVMGALAWHLVQEERRRSNARVAALVASLEADDPSLDLEIERDEASDADSGTSPEDAAPRDGMFADAARSEPDAARRLVAAGIAAAVLASGAALAWTTVRLLAPGAPAASAAPSQPLELLSLTSSRRGQELVVAGLVRNPRAGTRVDRVTAVVLFFDERGAFLTSSRAPLDFQVLSPGEESPFQLTLVAPEGTTRYRVSFRRAAGDIVPHVDRRASATPGTASTVAARARQAGL